MSTTRSLLSRLRPAMVVGGRRQVLRRMSVALLSEPNARSVFSSASASASALPLHLRRAFSTTAAAGNRTSNMATGGVAAPLVGKTSATVTTSAEDLGRLHSLHGQHLKQQAESANEPLVPKIQPAKTADVTKASEGGFVDPEKFEFGDRYAEMQQAKIQNMSPDKTSYFLEQKDPEKNYLRLKPKLRELADVDEVNARRLRNVLHQKAHDERGSMNAPHSTEWVETLGNTGTMLPSGDVIDSTGKLHDKLRPISEEVKENPEEFERMSYYPHPVGVDTASPVNSNPLDSNNYNATVHGNLTRQRVEQEELYAGPNDPARKALNPSYLDQMVAAAKAVNREVEKKKVGKTAEKLGDGAERGMLSSSALSEELGSAGTTLAASDGEPTSTASPQSTAESKQSRSSSGDTAGTAASAAAAAASSGGGGGQGGQGGSAASSGGGGGASPPPPPSNGGGGNNNNKPPSTSASGGNNNNNVQGNNDSGSSKSGGSGSSVVTSAGGGLAGSSSGGSGGSHPSAPGSGSGIHSLGLSSSFGEVGKHGGQAGSGPPPRSDESWLTVPQGAALLGLTFATALAFSWMRSRDKEVAKFRSDSEAWEAEQARIKDEFDREKSGKPSSEQELLLSQKNYQLLKHTPEISDDIFDNSDNLLVIVVGKFWHCVIFISLAVLYATVLLLGSYTLSTIGYLVLRKMGGLCVTIPSPKTFEFQSDGRRRLILSNQFLPQTQFLDGRRGLARGPALS